MAAVRRELDLARTIPDHTSGSSAYEFPHIVTGLLEMKMRLLLLFV